MRRKYGAAVGSRTINLEGSSASKGLLRMCSGHHQEVPSEGGVQLSPARWLCKECWINFNQRKKAA